MDGGPSITERVYAGIKADLLAGMFRPAQRLDAAALARQYGASITPIREALNRLAGERMIVVHAHQGFKVPLLAEGDVRALYDWACQQLIAALRLASPTRLSHVRGEFWPSPEAFDNDPVDAMERLCLGVAQLSGNTRCYQAIQQTNAELRHIRRLERQLMPPSTDDLRTLPLTLAHGDVATAEHLVMTYHRSRDAAASDIARLLTMAALQGLPSSDEAGGP